MGQNARATGEIVPAIPQVASGGHMTFFFTFFMALNDTFMYDLPTQHKLY